MITYHSTNYHPRLRNTLNGEIHSETTTVLKCFFIIYVNVEVYTAVNFLFSLLI